MVSGVHDSPLPQAQDSVSDIRGNAVCPSDHNAPAEPVLPAHGHGQQVAAEQRVLGRVPNNRIAGRVLLAALHRVPVRIVVRLDRCSAQDRARGQVAVVRTDHRLGAVQRATVRHQEQSAKEDVPELPAEDDDQVRGEPGDPSQDAVGLRVAAAIVDARAAGDRRQREPLQIRGGGGAAQAVVQHEPDRARRAAAPGDRRLGERPDVR